MSIEEKDDIVDPIVVTISKAALDELIEQTVTIASSRVIKTEEGRVLIAIHRRLLETMLNGKPTTKLPQTFHA